MELIYCKCNCGEQKSKYDNRGRFRPFINYHQNKKLKSNNYKVIRMWEHEIYDDLNKCLYKIEDEG